MSPLEARVHNLEVALMQIAAILLEQSPPSYQTMIDQLMLQFDTACRDLGASNLNRFIRPEETTDA